jgi:RNA ligase (TIGR02306 family)
MRKLASIQRILDIRPIPDADAIEVATINSWNVVVKKGEFAVNDLVVYCEVDSWIPHKLAPFLSKGQYPRVYEGVEGERLRTVKLRGQVSQGLILPLQVTWCGLHINEPYIGMAPWDYQGNWVNDDGSLNVVDVFVDGEWTTGTVDGLDVANRLGIVKYEPPVSAQLAGISKGTFPSLIPKTDEERVQNLTKYWSRLQHHEYEVTEKLEGSSMSVGLLDDEFIVCSRNLNLKETPDNTMWKIARQNDLEAKLRALNVPQGIVLQGEIIGEGIQGNHYGIKGHEFHVFAVVDVGAGRYLPPAERRALCVALCVKHVPVIDECWMLTISIDDVLKMADGKSALNPSKRREGIVFKLADGSGDQSHFKAVSNDYLLHHG